MKLVFTTFAAFILAISGVDSYAQDCSTDNPPSENCRTFGKAKMYFSEKPALTNAGIRLYLLGKPDDIVPDKNATSRIINDILIMQLGYSAPRHIIPQFIHLELKSFSNKPSKYAENNKLTIFLDDKPLLSEDMELQKAAVYVELFHIYLKYADFLEFTSGKKIKIQFGETKIELKDEEVEALNDLNKTTKHLVHPQVFAPIKFQN